MWTPLALLALVAPALAVPCGKNFTITAFSKGDACLGATYDSGFATVSKCDGSPGQTWMWDGLKIYNYVGPANNRACLTFSPCKFPVRNATDSSQHADLDHGPGWSPGLH